MSKVRVACVQMRSGVEIAPNIVAASDLIRDAAGQGAQLVATPEMTNLLDIRPGKARPKIAPEADDQTLGAMRGLAAELGIWMLIGSIAVTLAGEDRLANRSVLIAPDGSVRARYDKIHMFDVEVGDGQSYRESRAYRPGERAVLAETEFGKLGMTICYDVRFPHLYRKLAQAGAGILTIPAAFTRVTGKAHWHVLVRARAIETGSFVIAPAQGGKHEDGRETFGHSLIVSPWGEVLAEKADAEPGVILADLDLDAVAKARRRIPSLGNDQDIRFKD
ncbi:MULTISPECIES: carbon-nitrogen hydrolase family protein [unclassified Hyphomonas]|jgi:predicted amidohydrolase|uniref:carbon-nitrogen hydrolase family protein n=6 Tax=Hyphomonas TaxID=85 RepID=UPI000C92E880|nr:MULTISPECIES: carbon-nitrogen hydrolase family protein [unclassified Hyphomonas]MAL45096.1 amidohydrolase [Hyphomonas sp.]HAW57161.1 amidohydrolase [Hyphomonas sp.]HBX92036.1 amidohydrolase [Hyphomonas sp.]|tara:strand:+ start:843 stop:1673 length:831 start_codon:yes stop_codon:yes gene_type:complete